MEELNIEVCDLNQGGISRIELASSSSPDSFYNVEFNEDTARYQKDRKRSKEGTKIEHDLRFDIIKAVKRLSIGWRIMEKIIL